MIAESLAFAFDFAFDISGLGTLVVTTVCATGYLEEKMVVVAVVVVVGQGARHVCSKDPSGSKVIADISPVYHRLSLKQLSKPTLPSFPAIYTKSNAFDVE